MAYKKSSKQQPTCPNTQDRSMKILLDRATYESERGYEGYMAPRLADFDPYEMDAMGGIADMAYRGDPMQLQQA